MIRTGWPDTSIGTDGTLSFQMNPLDVLYPPPSYLDLTALKLPSISEGESEIDLSKSYPAPPILAFATPLPDRRRNSAPPAVEQLGIVNATSHRNNSISVISDPSTDCGLVAGERRRPSGVHWLLQNLGLRRKRRKALYLNSSDYVLYSVCLVSHSSM